MNTLQIKSLPNEIQNKIFYYLEHPVARLLKDAMAQYSIEDCYFEYITISQVEIIIFVT